MQRSSTLWVVTCVVLAMASTGCLERRSAAIGPNVSFNQEVTISGGGVTTVDVLFVIDNSGSMKQEQERLAAQVSRLVRDLASPPDNDGDGNPDWNPVEELRIGIATTDVGTANAANSAGNLYCPGAGDDGEIQGGVFIYREGEDADAYAANIAAVVDGLGIEGCGWEQPLEAAARAINRGGVDAMNRRFPSDDGLLAVILVTDEEDCSVDDDTSFFNAPMRGSTNVHCPRNVDRLTPITTLVEQIRGQRTADNLLFAAITGLPTDLPAGATPDQVLAHPGMEYMERDEAGDTRLVPACLVENPAGGDPLTRADPARRLVELARLVPDTVLHTICAEDFGPAIAEIAQRIGAKVPGVCLVREVPGGVGASVPCTINVTLPAGESCADWPAHSLIGSTPEGEQICDLAQAPGGEGEGFYYDPEAEGCAQLVITEAAQPPIGSAIHAECFFQLLLEEGELCARASQCDTGWCDPVDNVCAPLPAGMPGGPTSP